MTFICYVCPVRINIRLADHTGIQQVTQLINLILLIIVVIGVGVPFHCQIRLFGVGNLARGIDERCDKPLSSFHKAKHYKSTQN